MHGSEIFQHELYSFNLVNLLHVAVLEAIHSFLSSADVYYDVKEDCVSLLGDHFLGFLLFGQLHFSNYNCLNFISLAYRLQRTTHMIKKLINWQSIN